MNQKSTMAHRGIVPAEVTVKSPAFLQVDRAREPRHGIAPEDCRRSTAAVPQTFRPLRCREATTRRCRPDGVVRVTVVAMYWTLAAKSRSSLRPIPPSVNCASRDIGKIIYASVGSDVASVLGPIVLGPLSTVSKRAEGLLCSWFGARRKFQRRPSSGDVDSATNPHRGRLKGAPCMAVQIIEGGALTTLSQKILQMMAAVLSALGSATPPPRAERLPLGKLIGKLREDAAFPGEPFDFGRCRIVEEPIAQILEEDTVIAMTLGGQLFKLRAGATGLWSDTDLAAVLS